MTRAAPQPDFWQRRPARRAPPALEVRTHIALADLLRIWCKPGWFWSHIAHGGRRSEATGRLLQRMGLRPGLFDFLLISPAGDHHWLELKRGNAPLTEGQERFAEMLRSRGVPYCIARDYDAAVRQLTEWGVLNERAGWPPATERSNPAS